MKEIMICLDRDGTLIYDEKYHLGRTDDWKSKIQVLPTVIEGLKLLKTIPNVAIYVITNQPGVAVKDFPLFTLERAHEVCQHIINVIRKMGGHIDGYFLCPHAHPDYVIKRSKYKFDEKMVCDCVCRKPRLGMIFKALKAENLTLQDTDIYVLGDRSSDVQTALKAKGTGILVPFENESGQMEEVKELDQTHLYLAKNFLDAVQFIIRQRKEMA